MPRLNDPKKELLAMAIAGGAKQHEAYLQAGYKGTQPSANTMIRKPDMQERIHEIRTEQEEVRREASRKLAEDSTVDRAWIIRHLKHNTLAAMRGDPMYDKQGKPTGYNRPDRSAAMKGLELLGRTEGMFVDRTELGRPGDFSQLKDEELQAEIETVAKELGMPPDAVLLLAHLTKKTEDAE